jgi:putative DNA-invertase from lambdoid prophage Rac
MPRKQVFPQTQSRKVFGHPLRVGLYARVSTHDQQTLPLQIRAMREYAAKRNWAIVAHIKEVGSGASQRELRQALLAAARRREIDVVLVWRLDRWGRSVADLVSTLQELQNLGVGFVSLTEALDLTTPAGRAMAGLLAVFAEFEREILRERVRAGLAHARLNGKRLGRPPSAAHKAIEARNLYRQGISKSEIARRLNIGRTSVQRILAKKHLKSDGPTQPCRKDTLMANLSAVMARGGWQFTWRTYSAMTRQRSMIACSGWRSTKKRFVTLPRIRSASSSSSGPKRRSRGDFWRDAWNGPSTNRRVLRSSPIFLSAWTGRVTGFNI